MRPWSERRSAFARGLAGGLGLAVGAMTGLPAAVAGYGDSGVAARSTFAAVADWLAPEVSSQAVGKFHAGSAQYLANAIRQGGSYYVYANVVDSGNPPLGVSAVTADVSAISTGRTAEPLVAGSYSVEGVSYSYRTGAIPVDASLSGTKGYSITSTDGSNTPRVQGYTVTVDNTAPSAFDVQTAGDGDGRAETGETLTFTFSEAIDPESILAGWTGTATNVVVRVWDACDPLLGLACGSTPDLVRVYDAAGTTQLNLGQVNLPDDLYNHNCLIYLLGVCTSLGSDPPIVFSPSTMVRTTSTTITITLGTLVSGDAEAGGGGAMSWKPSSGAYDAAGNAMSTTARTEGNPASDKEF